MSVRLQGDSRGQRLRRARCGQFQLSCALLLTLAGVACAQLDQPTDEHGGSWSSRRLAAEPGPNELVPVATRDGWLMAPNSTADGSGCFATPNRIPTGLLVGTVGGLVGHSDCCRACREARSAGCNVWAYCPLEGGCPNVGPTLGSASSFGYRDCVLLTQGLSAPETGRPMVTIAAQGLIGGAPILATAAPIPGYNVYLGQGFFNRYDYSCADTITPGQCMLRGAVQDLAARCDADPLCRIMVHLPFGWDYIAPPLTVFKGAATLVVTGSDSTLNQNAAAYIKQAPPSTTAPSGGGGGSGLSAGAIAGIALGACAGAAAVMGGAAFVLRRRRRRQGMAKGAGAEASAAIAGKAPRCYVDSAKEVGASEKEARLQRTSTRAYAEDAAGGAHVAPPAVASPPWTQSPGRLPPRAGSQHASRTSSLQSALSLGVGEPSQSPAAGGSSATAQRAWSGPLSEAAQGPGPAGGLGARTDSVGQRSAGTQRSGSLEQRSWEAALGAISGARAASGQLASDASDSLGSPSATAILSRMPEVSWADEVVDFGAIEFSQKPDGSYVELGSGSFGTVYKVKLDGVQPMAAKVVDIGENEDVQLTFLREASVLRRLRHRNIVGFRGVSVSEGKGILLMELMEGGDLFSKITAVNRATGERTFGWAGRGRRVALDVARGIHHLHSLHLVHFDIKTNNVLLTRDLTAKISDVGFARLMCHTHYSVNGSKTGLGTFQYMAPELLLGRPCTETVDIYSFGVVLWELCAGEHPMRGRNRPLRVPEDCPAEVADLYERCTAEDPAQRPTAREVVEQLTRLVVPPGAIDRQ